MVPLYKDIIYEYLLVLIVVKCFVEKKKKTE